MLKGRDEEFDGMSDEANDIEKGLSQIDFYGFEIVEEIDGLKQCIAFKIS